MRRSLLTASLVTLVTVVLGAGCASPNKIREGAAAHEARAQQFEAEGRYDKAAKERAAAEKQRRKAARREYEWYGM